MRLFSVYTQALSAAADGQAEFVREGFSWPALIFPALWALWHRLWLLAIAIVAAQFIIGGLIAPLAADPVTPTALVFGLNLLIGFFANDWRRWFLARRGMVETALVAAPDRMAAEHRFFIKHQPRPSTQVRIT